MKELTLDAALDNIPKVISFVNEELEALGCPIETQLQMSVVIDEIFGNIAHYAYEDETGSVTVRVETEPEPQTFVLTFSDSGIPFDPLQMKAPDTTLKARDRKIGGLGIFMVKKMMDDVSYEYADGKNILILKKRI